MKTTLNTFTRGPWEAVPYEDGFEVRTVLDESNRHWTVADCVYGADNAALIAAAPELLEACKWALSELDGWIHDQLDGTRALGPSLKELQPIRDAIAKAEGRTCELSKK